MEKPLHRSTSRVLEILTMLAASPEGYTMTQIAQALNAPKSSLSPILQTLRSQHFLLYNNRTQLYKIGPSTFQVGMAFVNRTNILGYVEQEMCHIVDSCRETVHFAILDSGNVVYLLKKDSPLAVRMMSVVGLTLPAYGTGIGKALLIDKSLAELQAIYADGLQPLTDNTVTDFAELHRQLVSFRKDDVSYEYEESNPDIRCVGVALRKHGEIVAALSIAAPIFRCSDEQIQAYRSLLLESKQKLEPFFRDLQFDLTTE